MKNRILEIIDGNNESIFVPQYFNEYKGFKILKFLDWKPDQWINYTMNAQRIEFNTLDEAKKFIKSLESSTKIHDLI